MIHTIGRESGALDHPYEFEIETRHDTYTQTAHAARVSDGGVLLFEDIRGRAIAAVSPTGWTRVVQR